jgi:acetolactate synthase I/II/III large subunit
LNVLEAEGVRYIFGVPGGPLTGLFEALSKQSAIQLILAKHEASAAYMAATHARLTGKLAVCCATSGPGATNALTGIASAHADSLPVLLLSGQVATNVFGKGAIQESSVFGTDLVSVFQPVTKLSMMLPNAEVAADHLRAAIRRAMSGRRGAVHLSVPADILRKPIPFVPEPPARYRASQALIEPEAITRAINLLALARRPCVLAGHGVALANASDELAELVRGLQAPVMTSPKGKGVFPENDPLSLGVLGFGGHELAESYVRSGDIDVLLVVGSSLNEFVTNAWTLPLSPKVALIQIDIDPCSFGKTYPVDVAIGGDAKACLREMCQVLGQQQRGSGPVSFGPRLLRDSTGRYLDAAKLTSDSVPLKPQRLIAELRAAMPDDALLFVDNGTSIVWAGHYFEIRTPGTYFVDLGLASMGSAVAGVVGGALAAPNRRSVALVGDAAFAMQGFEVHTAVEYRLPIVWVVLNNGGHGMVRQGDTLMHGAPLGVSDFRVNLDLAGVGRALGANGVTVRTPAELRQALEAALQAATPTVIDAIIDPNEMAPTLVRRVQTLNRFLSNR